MPDTGYTGRLFAKVIVVNEREDVYKMEKILSVVIAFGLILSLGIGQSSGIILVSAEKERAVSGVDSAGIQVELREIYQDFLSERSSGFNKGELNFDTDLIPDLVNDAHARSEGIKALANRMGAVFDQVSDIAELRDVHVIDSTAIDAEFYVVTTIDYHYEGVDHSEDFAAYGLIHHVSFENRQGSWYITRDSFDERDVTGVVSADVLRAEGRMTYEDSIPASGRESYQDTGLSGTRTGTFSYSSATLNDALEYAVTYCGIVSDVRRFGSSESVSGGSYLNYNPLYGLPSSNGDCANFVSQILYDVGVET